MNPFRSYRNLNLAELNDADGNPRPLVDPRASSHEADVECVFRDIEDRLVEELSRYSHVVGCVAWLSNERVLLTMACRKGVALIVQKEDWLRPDACSRRPRENLRELYGQLSGMERANFESLGRMSMCADPGMDPVRCAGVVGRGDLIIPRCHHKFVVFGHVALRDGADPNELFLGDEIFVPEAVWTGSFNFSENATRSLENAVIIRDRTIAAAYLVEFEQVAGLSEPLDWTHVWVAPEWRFGT